MLENNIKSLIKILEESKVDELEVSSFWGKQKIRIRKNSSSALQNNIQSTNDSIDVPDEGVLPVIEVSLEDEASTHNVATPLS